MLAAVTPLPVIGVPVPLKHLDGMDSLLSIVQMPAGVPVATVASATPATPACSPYASSRAPTPRCSSRWCDFQAELRPTAQEKGKAVRGDAGPRRLGF